ncbi:MAG: hypothetical protein IPH84_19710 [Bacteroidales bacterium]|nr:hypothetical protein [Bacteroidales bacterium]
MKTMPLQAEPALQPAFNTPVPVPMGRSVQDSSWSYQALVTGWNWEFEPYQYGNGQNPNHVYCASDSCYNVSADDHRYPWM